MITLSRVGNWGSITFVSMILPLAVRTNDQTAVFSVAIGVVCLLLLLLRMVWNLTVHEEPFKRKHRAS